MFEKVESYVQIYSLLRWLSFLSSQEILANIFRHFTRQKTFRASTYHFLLPNFYAAAGQEILANLLSIFLYLIITV